MGTVILAAMFLLVSCGSSAGPSSAPSTSQPPAPPPSISSISPTSGPTSGGTTVTINGANFQKGATVTFGGAAATSDSLASSTKLTATSPKGNVGTAAVVVTNTDGQTGTLAAGFTYTDTGSGGGGGLSGSPGATATQYVLTYTASTNKMCTIEVSQNQSFTPLVHAVDPSIFPGSDSDGQTNIGQRTFVVGERTIAAETDTAPSIVVGAGNATRAPMKYGGYTTGAVTVAYSGQPFVAGDNIIVSGMSDSSFDSTWARVMSASANSFTYWTPTTTAGTSGGGTITRSDHFSLALENNTTYYYRIGGPSNTCGATPAEGTFTTMNWPNGDTFAETFPTGPHGHWVTPTILETHDPSINTVIDPTTGTLVRPLSLLSDEGQAFMVPAFNGDRHTCTMQADSNGFYHCMLIYNGGEALYGINETTGEVRHLGRMQVHVTGCPNVTGPPTDGSSGWDISNPNVFYGMCNGSGTTVVVWTATYTGSDVAVSGATQISATTSVLSSDLGSQVQAFDPTFNAQFYTSMSPGWYVSSHYLILGLGRWNQGAPAWLVVFDLSTSSVVAALNCWGNQVAATCSSTSCSGGSPLRWAGVHNIPDFGGVPQGWVFFDSSHLKQGQKTMGYFYVNLSQATGLNATDASDTVTVTSGPTTPWASGTYAANSFILDSNGCIESTYAGGTTGATAPSWPACSAANINVATTDSGVRWVDDGPPGNPISEDIAPDGSAFLDQLEPGDVLQFQDTGNELVMVTARTSPTSITIARGCHSTYPAKPVSWVCDGTGEVSHSDGATLYSDPNVTGDADPSYFDWNFVADPHGHDLTGTNLIWDQLFLAGHTGSEAPCTITEAYGVRCGSPWDSTLLKKQADFYISKGPPFAGIGVDCPGNACQPYPHFFPLNPSTTTWAWDPHTYAGGPYTTDSNSAIASGSGYVIEKYSFGSGHTFSPALPYFSVSGPRQLINISGSGSALPASALGNYEFCIAEQVGECWTGSSVGDVYANFPSATTGCVVFENGGVTGDWCLTNMPPMAQGALQLGMRAANQIGTQGGKPVYGMGNSRKLVSGLFGIPRMGFAHIMDLPDQSWIFWENCLADPYENETSPRCDYQTMMAKVPPQPPQDGIDRTNFEAVPIPVGTATGATQARLKWGYEEDEAMRGTIHFYCQQYQGTCYWNGSALSPSFVPSTFASLSLNSTETLSIGIPQRVLFYQIEYLNDSNQIVGTGPMHVVAIP